ncbi:DUF4382 domain-containing protein [Halobacteriaceae archaeon GCM10025711]
MRRTIAAVALAALVVLAGCTGGVPGGPTTDDGQSTTADGQAATGTLNFYVSDEKNAIDQFEHLNVTITQVGLKKASAGDGASTTATTEENATTTDNESTTNATTEDEEAETEEADGEDDDVTWVTHDVNNTTVDLTELQGENASMLATFDVESATYEGAFVYVSEVNGTLVDGEHVNVKLPSGKLKINKQFAVGADAETDFVFDVTVVEAGNSGKYNLQPVVTESGTDVPIRDVDEQDDDEAKNEGKSDDKGDNDDKGEKSDKRDENGQQAPDSALNVSVNGTVAPGENVTVTVTRNGSAVADAAVTLDGDDVGTTAADGTITVAVPDDADRFELTVTAGDDEAEFEREFGSTDE